MSKSVAVGDENPSVFVLAWNPSFWPVTEDELQATIAATARGGTVPSSWATGNRKSGIEPDDHLVMMRQGTERDLIAHGFARSAIRQGEHFHETTNTANYVELEWTLWLDTDESAATSSTRSSTRSSIGSWRAESVRVSSGTSKARARAC